MREQGALPIDGPLLEQLEVGKSESLLQQDGDSGPKDKEAILKSGIALIAEMDRNEPDERGQEQRHQPEKRSAEREQGAETGNPGSAQDLEVKDRAAATR